jgi:hypothetical protein
MPQQLFWFPVGLTMCIDAAGTNRIVQVDEDVILCEEVGLDGLANWTDLGRTGGRDPLAMLSAVEYAYQTLLPGLNTVTERLRYYAFHCWWIADYAGDTDDAPTKSAADYGDRARRAEMLYALASLCVPDDPAATSDERGISGAIKTRRVLREGEATIDFRAMTDRETPPDKRYIKPAMGDFLGTYSAPMREIGLLQKPSIHNLNVPLPRGVELARHFEESLGEAAELFRQTAKARVVDRATLARLAHCRPGEIPPESGEADMLRNLLMGRLEADPETVPENQRTDAIRRVSVAQARRNTLLWILETAKDNPQIPLDQDMLRWHWFKTPVDPGNPLAHTHARWQHYQCGDTARVCCEVMLAHAVRLLNKTPEGIALDDLLTALTVPLNSEGSLGQWLARINAAQEDEPMEYLQATALEECDNLEGLIAPLARLHRDWCDREEDLAEAFPDDRPGKQTVRTLLRWIDRQTDTPAAIAMRQFFRDFILMRHLMVAAGKFRRDSAYTYLFELHAGRLHWRQMTSGNPSAPRLEIALRFLDDLDLLKDGKITKRGETLLESEAA